MTNGIRTLNAISLFVEDLAATRDFYIRVFAVPIVFQDENSAVAQFDNLLVNLLKVESAAELVEPGFVAPKEAGSRFQLSIWIDDVDSVCTRLRREAGQSAVLRPNREISGDCPLDATGGS